MEIRYGCLVVNLLNYGMHCIGFGNLSAAVNGAIGLFYLRTNWVMNVAMQTLIMPEVNLHQVVQPFGAHTVICFEPVIIT